MDNHRLLAPVMAALNIQEQYHKEVEARLISYGLNEEARSTILTDIYAKDDMYFSLNRSYESIPTTFDDYCKQQKLHYSLTEMVLRGTGQHLYTHQAQAIESILAEKTTIISTGTGSGKTESFLIPIFHHCLLQKNRQSPGIKAIILYPLNALANDQIRRILDAVKGKGVRVGCFIGSTPYEKARTRDDQDEFCVSRKEMIELPPDILITNYVMLDRLLTKAQTYRMFTMSADTLKYIVVDEIHYFRGTKGANLSLLLRRLRTLCKGMLVQIGASGTLRRGGGYYPDQTENQIKEFVRLIFGQEAIETKGFTLVAPIFQAIEPDEQPDPLPDTDKIIGEAFLTNLDKNKATELCRQLFGPTLYAEYEQKYCLHKSGLQAFPGYHLALHSPFIVAIRKNLQERACTFQALVALFRQCYEQAHHRLPEDPKVMVEAYWSLINYLNLRCEEKYPLVLDYRIHLILGDVGETLTCCLLCQRYHDSRCRRCRYCNNGLLFKVSKRYPNQCIAYLHKDTLSPDPIVGEHSFPVLVALASLRDEMTTEPSFTLEPNIDPSDDVESYLLIPTTNVQEGVVLRLIEQKQDEEALPLSEKRLYWQNILKIVDALVLQSAIPKDKLLGFIDSRERASSIKLRLSDEIAERTLITWAAHTWERNNALNLTDAFELLQQSIPLKDEDTDTLIISDLLQEIAFWFTRMLTYLEEGAISKYWTIGIDPQLPLNSNEAELLHTVLLPANAIDTTSFAPSENIHALKHFHVEKYRVETQYGVGMKGSTEPGYHILSLGEQGRRYEEVIERIGSTHLEAMLKRLVSRGILVEKTTPAQLVFYQLHPSHVLIQRTNDLAPDWSTIFATVECHTADNSSEERSEIEYRFSAAQTRTLICTPTLEMGVDIGRLSKVLMIGFPPSPANYAQRAGRAGRSARDRQATIVVLSSSENMHDEYYYSVPNKMIDGEITPPQFSLVNFPLLAAHSYASIMAGARDLNLLTQPHLLHKRIHSFLYNDDLHIAHILGEHQYTAFSHYILQDCLELHKRLRALTYKQPSIEDCYKHGIFPDYGFRNDGLPLVDTGATNVKEDEFRLLTSREPEEAPRKLAPGRIVFCGGRAVKVEENQPTISYQIQQDPNQQPFRNPRYVVTNTAHTVQIEKLRDPDQRYRISRFLDCYNPLSALSTRGRQYCQVYYVPESTLYFINEGLPPSLDRPLTGLIDQRGSYRFGTSLEREGLLIRFADRILSPQMKANFLAVLLRAIPDCFNLDDNELRVVQHIQIYPQNAQEMNFPSTYFFLYGHDKSGLVPFQKIFDELDGMLSNALEKLKTCSCQRQGCYLCLFSMNSHILTGHLSPESAIAFLTAYRGETRLKPSLRIVHNQSAPVDLTLFVKVQGNHCEIIAQTAETSTPTQYRGEIHGNQNEVLYHLLYQVLIHYRSKGLRSVKICCRLDYILKQLRGEYEVRQGREAFFKVWLERLNWLHWHTCKEEKSW